MAENESFYLSSDDLLLLDARYEPILSFADWAKETGTNVGTAWGTYVEQFKNYRATLEGTSLVEIVQKAMRAAAINTGALENLHRVDRGLTITVMEEAATWQAAVSNEIGLEATELVEAALEGYEMALDLATGNAPLNEAWIRRIHEVVCRPQKSYSVLSSQGWSKRPLALGVYKADPNHVRLSNGRVHPYAPVGLTSEEMFRLITEVRSVEFGSAHPALQAAYVHHALTAIHPFADGNGRVARVIASVFTLRSAHVPLVIFDDQKPLYLSSLELADKGRPDSLIYFINDRVVDILGLLVETMRGSYASITPYLERLTDLLTGQGGLSHIEIDAIATRLWENIGKLLVSALAGHTIPQGITIHPMTMTPYQSQNVPDFARSPGGSSQVLGGIILAGSGPVQVQVQLEIRVLIKKNRSDRYPFIVQVHRAGNSGLSRELVDEMLVRVDEVYPQESLVFQMKMEAWTKRLIGDAFELFITITEEELRKAGM